MDGLATLKAARVDLDELVLDPAYPFAVRPAPRLTEKRRREMKAALRGDWSVNVGAAERVPVARVLIARLNERDWAALLDATVDARIAAEPDPRKRWDAMPWSAWRTTLDDEQDRRDRARPVVQAAMGIKARLKEAA